MADLKALSNKIELDVALGNLSAARTFTKMRDLLNAALSHAAGQEADKPLTADMAKALPGGNLDDSTFQSIEEALDAAEAPMRGADGKWLTLPERIRALSRGVAEGNQDVAAARRERDEAIEEKEYAELELAYLANEMVYEGNSIGWIASKAKKYGDALHRAWTALTEAGGKCDGQTELAEAIRQHFAAIAAQRKEG